MKAETQSRWIVQREKNKGRYKTLKQTSVDDEGADSSNSQFEAHICGKTEKDKIDPPINTGYFHTGDANALNFIVYGGNVVNSIVMRSKKSLKTRSCH